MIQSIANDDKDYRKIDTSITKQKGSGHCTAYPLSWWQNCPEGSKPSGSRGWSNKGGDNACNKWYQHISGELMCSEFKSNYSVPLGGKCNEIIDTIRTVKNAGLTTPGGSKNC